MTGYPNIRAQKIGETDFVERAANRDIDALPGATDVTGVFEIAMAVAGAALGNRNRTLERIDDIRRTDLGCVPGELVAAVRATGRTYDFGFCQCFQQLANGWKRDTGRAGDLRGADQVGCIVAGQVRQYDGAVVGKPADTQHGRTP